MLAVHWVYEGLVAVAEVGREPAGHFGEGFGGPCSVGEVEGFEGAVFFRGVFEPVWELGMLLNSCGRWTYMVALLVFYLLHRQTGGSGNSSSTASDRRRTVSVLFGRERGMIKTAGVFAV